MPAVLFAHRVCICILKHKQKSFWDVKIITGLCEHIFSAEVHVHVYLIDNAYSKNNKQFSNLNQFLVDAYLLLAILQTI